MFVQESFWNRTLKGKNGYAQFQSFKKEVIYWPWHKSLNLIDFDYFCRIGHIYWSHKRTNTVGKSGQSTDNLTCSHFLVGFQPLLRHEQSIYQSANNDTLSSGLFWSFVICERQSYRQRKSNPILCLVVSCYTSYIKYYTVHHFHIYYDVAQWMWLLISTWFNWLESSNLSFRYRVHHSANHKCSITISF